MKFLLAALVVASSAVAASAGPAAAQRRMPAQTPAPSRALLDQYCLGCHNADKREGGVRLDDLTFVIKTSGDAERWQNVLNVLNSGEMPPPSAKPIDPGLAKRFAKMEVASIGHFRYRGFVHNSIRPVFPVKGVIVGTAVPECPT